MSKGFSIAEMLVTMTLLVLLSAGAIFVFSNYQVSTEKKLHVVNAIELQTTIQRAMLKGQIQKPEVSKTVDLSINDLLNETNTLEIFDPTTGGDSRYHNDSRIQLYNNGGVIEYYILLKNKETKFEYINTTTQENTRGSKKIGLLKKSDIVLDR